MSYYDGTKLLSLLDLNNKRPEIYMVTSNRTGGKTTNFYPRVKNLAYYIDMIMNLVV